MDNIERIFHIVPVLNNIIHSTRYKNISISSDIHKIVVRDDNGNIIIQIKRSFNSIQYNISKHIILIYVSNNYYISLTGNEELIINGNIIKTDDELFQLSLIEPMTKYISHLKELEIKSRDKFYELNFDADNNNISVLEEFLGITYES